MIGSLISLKSFILMEPLKNSPISLGLSACIVPNNYSARSASAAPGCQNCSELSPIRREVWNWRIWRKGGWIKRMSKLSEFFGQQWHDIKGNAKWDFVKWTFKGCFM